MLGRRVAHLVADSAVAGDGQAGRRRGVRIDGGEQLGGRQPHLVANRLVARDGQAGRSRGVRIDSGQLLGGRQPHLVANCLVAGDGRESLRGGMGTVFGQTLGRVDAVLVVFVHCCVGFLFKISSSARGGRRDRLRLAVAAVGGG